MKNSTCRLSLTIGLIWLITLARAVLAQPPSQSSEAIPVAELGAKAGAQYHGDGLSVMPTPDGARLRCVFQKLEGEITFEGLWLTSTSEPQTGEKFRVMARAVGREGALTTLPPQGTATMAGKLARCVRPGLTEEYSVSVDGVRQDFVLHSCPEGEGSVRVELAVEGAKAEALGDGARLVLADRGRKIAYNRLRATDAAGRELTARLEVSGTDRLALIVDDVGAAYPLRIDPTFSDENWVSMGTTRGFDGEVRAVVVDASDNLYIGGSFTVAPDIILNRIAKWNGSAWSALGSGMGGNYPVVYALATSGTNLYVGGYFTTAGGVAVSGVAKWDGYTWSPLGLGVGFAGGAGVVHALATSGTNLYVGGNFTTAGGVTASGVAKWDGNTWSPLGSGMGGQYLEVDALVVSGSDLYAGGQFTTAGGVSASRIAKWDGSAWSALGSGMDSYVYALATSGTNLYAGGSFTTAGGVSANRIAKWDGHGWTALSSGMNNLVNALAVSGDDLYAGGAFSTAGGISASRIAKWNGSGWSSLGYGVAGVGYPAVYALAASSGNVYVGGFFENAGFINAGFIRASRIAMWNGSDWSALGQGFASGIDGPVYAVAISGNDLYVGGDFDYAGSIIANNIAKWDGSVWSSLGSGLSPGSAVYALAMWGTNLYVGGYFTTAGGVDANNIAKWDGFVWAALGNGVGRSDGLLPWVSTLVVSGNELYAGGRFDYAGWFDAPNIAKWDGNAWSALGTGMTAHPVITSKPYVSALAILGGELYAGGAFTFAGGIACYNIAKWNGSAWSPVGPGMGGGTDPFYGEVSALAVFGSDMYAGGSFTTVGIVSAKYIAKWNGSVWSSMGTGMNGKVSALAVSGGDVYAGGSFTTASGANANRIAKWDGSTWSPLGSGMGGGGSTFGGTSVRSLAVSNTNLYVGGDFATAGDKISPDLTRAILSGEPRITSQPVSQTVAVGSSVTLSLTAAGADPLTYQWRFNGANLSNDGRISGASTSSLTISSIYLADRGEYTVVLTNVYGSVTSSVLVLTLVGPGQTFSLLDYYYPIYPGNRWSYDSSDNGSLWTTTCRILSAAFPLNCYSNCSPVVPYTRNTVPVLFDQGGGTTWTNFMHVADPGFGYVGSDHVQGSRLRFGPGFIFTNRFALGQTVSVADEIYSGGICSGQGTQTIQLLGLADVTVPYGTFTDCLHLMISNNILGSAQVEEHWWAKGVGPVKWTHGGGGDFETNQLQAAAFVSPPWITVQPQSQTVSAGSAVNFNVEAIGNTPLSYQWRKHGTNLVNGGNLSGVTTANLMLTECSNQ